MFCYKCGASMPDTSTVCPQCAAPVQQTAQPAAQPSQPGMGLQAGAASQPRAAVLPNQYQQPVSPWLNVPPAAQAYPAYTGVQETEGKAVGSLILGILSIFPLGLLAGIPAIILGHMSRKSIRESMGRLKGGGMALAGLIMGYLSVATIPLVLIIAAIAIPNLLRAKMAANESSAAATVRTLNIAQVGYTTEYPQAGYAPSLEALGAGGAPQCGERSAQHACLIDPKLGCIGTWCFRNGYKYNVTAICRGENNSCTDYVVTATPMNPGATGRRSFCSTSDAVVRFSYTGIASPVDSPELCQAWPAI